jgi:hypothetical protein
MYYIFCVMVAMRECHATAAAAVQRHATVKPDRVITAWHLQVYPVSLAYGDYYFMRLQSGCASK